MYADLLEAAYSVCTVAGRPQAVYLLNLCSERGRVLRHKLVNGNMCLNMVKYLCSLSVQCHLLLLGEDALCTN